MSPAGMMMEAVTVTAGRTVSDEDLVAALREGDDRAFEVLFARYQRRITAYVAGMAGDHGRAEDLTQEVFIAALRRMRATDGPIAFKPWIYEIAKNACIDHFRRSRRAEEVSLEGGQAAGTLDPARLATTAPSPEAALEAKQQIDDLRGAFGGLSDAHHQILVLRELEGLSYQQIGERLSLTRPSVESTLFRARRRLSEEYRELASGERCRSVQRLVAHGPKALGARERTRMVRHIAHCRPCRRHAFHAGVDTRALTAGFRRDAARRMAVLFPRTRTTPAAPHRRPAAGHAPQSGPPPDADARHGAAAAVVKPAAAPAGIAFAVVTDDDAAFLESLMDTGLYTLGAAFQDDHPDLVDDVIAQAEAIEELGLERWAATQDIPVQAAFQTFVTGLSLRYYRALGA